MFYYAILTDNGVATSKETSSTAVTNVHYIEITEEQYNEFESTLRNKSWDAYTKTFVPRVYWTCNAEDVHENSEVIGLKLKDSLTMIKDEVETCLHLANTEFTLTNNYGTYQGACPVSLTEGCAYLISINYINNNTLADRTLYILRRTADRLQPTIMLVGGNNGNDSLLVANTNGTLTFSTQYTGTATTANIRII